MDEKKREKGIQEIKDSIFFLPTRMFNRPLTLRVCPRWSSLRHVSRTLCSDGTDRIAPYKYVGAEDIEKWLSGK